ncbi:hypothetical protein QBC39DRAFT_410782, partial [Podospora conica]
RSFQTPRRSATSPTSPPDRSASLQHHPRAGTSPQRHSNIRYSSTPTSRTPAMTVMATVPEDGHHGPSSSTALVTAAPPRSTPSPEEDIYSASPRRRRVPLVDAGVQTEHVEFAAPVDVSAAAPVYTPTERIAAHYLGIAMARLRAGVAPATATGAAPSTHTSEAQEPENTIAPHNHEAPATSARPPNVSSHRSDETSFARSSAPDDTAQSTAAAPEASPSSTVPAPAAASNYLRPHVSDYIIGTTLLPWDEPNPLAPTKEEFIKMMVAEINKIPFPKDKPASGESAAEKDTDEDVDSTVMASSPGAKKNGIEYLVLSREGLNAAKIALWTHDFEIAIRESSGEALAEEEREVTFSEWFHDPDPNSRPPALLAHIRANRAADRPPWAMFPELHTSPPRSPEAAVPAVDEQVPGPSNPGPSNPGPSNYGPAPFAPMVLSQMSDTSEDRLHTSSPNRTPRPSRSVSEASDEAIAGTPGPRLSESQMSTGSAEQLIFPVPSSRPRSPSDITPPGPTEASVSDSLSFISSDDMTVSDSDPGVDSMRTPSPENSSSN